PGHYSLFFWSREGHNLGWAGQFPSRYRRIAGVVMKHQLSVLRKIAPEIGELIERRHAVLQSVHFVQPIGRRALAARLGWPERMVRKEIDFLRESGLLQADASGMLVSPTGEYILEELKEIIREFHGLTELENELARRLVLQLRQAVELPDNFLQLFQDVLPGGGDQHPRRVRLEQARLPEKVDLLAHHALGPAQPGSQR